jgi:hypothetical protein
MRLGSNATLALGLLIGACSNSSGASMSPLTKCTPLTTATCSCGAGLGFGSMMCGTTGEYGACSCAPSGAAGASTAGRPAINSGTAGNGLIGATGTGATGAGGRPAIGGTAGTGPAVGAGGNSLPPPAAGRGAPPAAGHVAAGSGGTTGGGAAGGAAPSGGSNEPKIPDPPANCPAFTNGGTVNIPRVSGEMVPVTIYIDPAAQSKPAPGGPLIIYWHATLSSPVEVLQGFGQQNIDAVTAAGGVVAAPATTACNGCTTTDDGYWFEEDDVVADQIVSCAIKNAKIDVSHIHTLGWSAGGLHTTHVAQARSNYIASFISYSGGLYLLPSMDQDPTNKVAGILTYGDPGSDVVVLDFNAQSQSWGQMFQPLGWYSMMCHHPGGHEVDPEIAPLSLKFFKDHPFKVSPEPYASMIPAGYPAYCTNMFH